MGNNYEDKAIKYVRDRDNYNQDSSKRKLKGQITTKMRTLMIGTIAQIEKFLGEDWGHGLTDEQCDDNQLDTRVTWRQLRESILDFGNTKIREMEKEVDKYIVETNSYSNSYNRGNNVKDTRRV